MGLLEKLQQCATCNILHVARSILSRDTGRRSQLEPVRRLWWSGSLTSSSVNGCCPNGFLPEASHDQATPHRHPPGRPRRPDRPARPHPLAHELDGAGWTTASPARRPGRPSRARCPWAWRVPARHRAAGASAGRARRCSSHRLPGRVRLVLSTDAEPRWLRHERDRAAQPRLHGRSPRRVPQRPCAVIAGYPSRKSSATSLMSGSADAEAALTKNARSEGSSSSRSSSAVLRYASSSLS